DSRVTASQRAASAVPLKSRARPVGARGVGRGLAGAVVGEVTGNGRVVVVAGPGFAAEVGVVGAGAGPAVVGGALMFCRSDRKSSPPAPGGAVSASLFSRVAPRTLGGVPVGAAVVVVATACWPDPLGPLNPPLLTQGIPTTAAVMITLAVSSQRRSLIQSRALMAGSGLEGGDGRDRAARWGVPEGARERRGGEVEDAAVGGDHRVAIDEPDHPHHRPVEPGAGDPSLEPGMEGEDAAV